MKAFITGIEGFAGSHLAEHLLAGGWDVAGCALSLKNISNIAHLKDRLKLFEADITKLALRDAVAEARPDALFHLAAVAFVPDAEKNPGVAVAVNVGGTENAVRAMLDANGKGSFVLASSAEVYGRARPEPLPLAEDAPPAPASVYAKTKLEAECAAAKLAKGTGLRLVILRPFNHTGARQSASFALPSFASQVANIMKGSTQPIIKVGNLDAARDFTDVRDVVRAYALAAAKAEPFTPYNIASGRAYVIKDLLAKLIALSGREIKVETDPARMRKSDVPVLLGSAEKFRKATGWKPEIPIDDTLKALLDYFLGAKRR